MMSPCLPSPNSPNMAFSPPFMPRPEFGLGGLLQPSSAPSLPFPGKNEDEIFLESCEFEIFFRLGTNK